MRSSSPGWPTRAAYSGANRACTASRIFAFSLLRAIQLRSPAALAGCALGTPAAAALGGTVAGAAAAAGFAAGVGAGSE